MNYRIAMLDDNPIDSLILKKALESEGIEMVIGCTDGLDFLNRLHQAEPLPHLCIVDLVMPEIDGFEIIKRIRSNWPEIKIIAYSSLPQAAVVNRVIKAGANLMIPKGVPPKNLIATIIELIKKAE